MTHDVINDIELLGRLEPNWDCYGSLAIDPHVIDAAKSFIGNLPDNKILRPRVIPMSKGGIQLEWHRGQKSIELEFESEGLIRYLKWHPENGIEEESSFDIMDFESAINLISWILV